MLEDNEITNYTLVFATLSVAKNSANFWNGYSNDEDGLYYTQTKVNWRDVGIADAAGVLLGLPAGGFGVLGGAIGCSALSAAAQYWKW